MHKSNVSTTKINNTSCVYTTTNNKLNKNKSKKEKTWTEILKTHHT